MPIYIDGELIWVDAEKAITFNYDSKVLASHLVHVQLLLDGGYQTSNTGLFMPCGDIFPDDTTVMYRITQFGTVFLVMQYADIELVMPVTIELRNQINLLIQELGK